MTKRKGQMISAFLTVLMLFSCLQTQTYAQEKNLNAPEVLWVHLYTRYGKIYLIGKTEKEYSNRSNQSVDVSCRLAGREANLHCAGRVEKKLFVIRLEILEVMDIDPKTLQGVSLVFKQDFFEEGAPEFEYSTDDLVTDEPVLVISDRTLAFTCISEGTNVLLTVTPDAFMFVPIQLDPQWFNDVSFDFGSARFLPTKYSYDGQTLAIKRLGLISDYDQLQIDEEVKLIHRSFRMEYKGNSVDGQLEIEPNNTLLFQQRRIMWLYLICGGFFAKFLGFVSRVL